MASELLSLPYIKQHFNESYFTSYPCKDIPKLCDYNTCYSFVYMLDEITLHSLITLTELLNLTPGEDTIGTYQCLNYVKLDNSIGCLFRLIGKDIKDSSNSKIINNIYQLLKPHNNISTNYKINYNF